jgi:hypothetical protein
MNKLPFLRFDYKTPILRDWLLFEQEQGCTPVQGGLCLQMEKSPPALPQSVASAASKAAAAVAPSPAPAPPAPPAPPSPPKKDAAVAFLEWMIERGEKKQEKAQAQQNPPTRTLPKPFDLYDLPPAQRAAGFSVGAKLSQRWLDGRAYTAYGPDGKEGRYDSDMVDMTTVSLSWLRGYDKIEKRYQALLGKLDTSTALKVLRDNFAKYLNNYSGMSHELKTREHCQGDWQAVHADFQFQLETVGMLDTLTDTLGMTDVTAALANFAFYAAVAKANVKTAIYNRYNTPSGTQNCRKSTVEVTHVWVYAKDSYSFHDEGASSQYLGHWNKNGVIVLPAAVAASVGMKKIADAARDDKKENKFARQQILDWLNSQRIELWNDEVWRFPLDIGRSWAEKEVYYSVRNSDHRRWREIHNRGGDFLIMTEPKLVKLDQPIVLDMPEMCK